MQLPTLLHSVAVIVFLSLSPITPHSSRPGNPPPRQSTRDLMSCGSMQHARPLHACADGLPRNSPLASGPCGIAPASPTDPCNPKTGSHPQCPPDAQSSSCQANAPGWISHTTIRHALCLRRRRSTASPSTLNPGPQHELVSAHGPPRHPLKGGMGGGGGTLVSRYRTLLPFQPPPPAPPPLPVRERHAHAHARTQS